MTHATNQRGGGDSIRSGNSELSGQLAIPDRADGASTTGILPVARPAWAINPWEINLRPTGDHPFFDLNARAHLLADNSTGLDLFREEQVVSQLSIQTILD